MAACRGAMRANSDKAIHTPSSDPIGLVPRNKAVHSLAGCVVEGWMGRDWNRAACGVTMVEHCRTIWRGCPPGRCT